MNRDVRARWSTFCVAMLLATLLATLLAMLPARAQQPTAEYYDTKKMVTVKGTLRGMIAIPPPSPMLIMVETVGANGQKEMCVLSGNPMTTLRRDGWQLIGPASAVRSGDEITVTAYLPRDMQKAAKALAAALTTMPSPDGRPAGPPGFIADIEAKRARLAYGLEITKADGQTFRFGDAP